jgi:hypothetical protein
MESNAFDGSTSSHDIAAPDSARADDSSSAADADYSDAPAPIGASSSTSSAAASSDAALASSASTSTSVVVVVQVTRRDLAFNEYTQSQLLFSHCLPELLQLGVGSAPRQKGSKSTASVRHFV